MRWGITLDIDWDGPLGVVFIALCDCQAIADDNPPDALANTLDKRRSHEALAAAGVRVPQSVVVSAEEWERDKLANEHARANDTAAIEKDEEAWTGPSICRSARVKRSPDV